MARGANAAGRLDVVVRSLTKPTPSPFVAASFSAHLDVRTKTGQRRKPPLVHITLSSNRRRGGGPGRTAPKKE